MWQLLFGVLGLWLLVEAIRAVRAWRKEREFVARSLRPGAGLSHGMPKRSFWDFLRYG